MTTISRRTYCHCGKRCKVYRIAYWHVGATSTLDNFKVGASPSESSGPTIQVGNLVIIKDSNTPTLQWKMGRITEVYPGSDGVVRVAMVYTNSESKKRAVRLPYPLPSVINHHKKKLIIFLLIYIFYSCLY